MADPFTTAVALRDAIVRGELSAEAAVRHALDRIAALDPIAARIPARRCRARARPAPARSTPPGPPAGPLHGVPIALKDNIAVRGMRTTAGSRILENYVSPFDATVVERLERAGAVIVGKTDLRRVRDGLVDRALRVRPVAQSVGDRSHSGRIERRIGGRRRRRA